VFPSLGFGATQRCAGTAILTLSSDCTHSSNQDSSLCKAHDTVRMLVVGWAQNHVVYVLALGKCMWDCSVQQLFSSMHLCV
jgi:hypothetical protein